MMKPQTPQPRLAPDTSPAATPTPQTERPAARPGVPLFLQGPARIQRCACTATVAADPAMQADPDSDETWRVQRKAGAADGTAGSLPAVQAQRFESGGVALSPARRAQLEPRFRADLAAVRLHDDSGSHAAARALQARAFTYGQHIHFGAGEWHPDTPAGLHLLAHELTHTLQQRGSAPVAARAAVEVEAAVEVDAADSPLERAADRMADAVMAEGNGAAAGPVGHVGGRLQRRVQREALNGTRRRPLDANTDIEVTRTVEERPCRRVNETRATAPGQIFYWDDAARAVGLRYELCNGKVKLSTGASVDYARVETAAQELLQGVLADPLRAGDAVRTAVNSATIDAQGHVRFTVDKVLDLTVSGESSVGVGSQSASIKARLTIEPGRGRVTVVVEAGAGVTRDAAETAVQRYVRSELHLGEHVQIVVQLADATGQPATLQGAITIPLGNSGVAVGPTLSTDFSGRPTVGVGITGTLGRPDSPAAVRCETLDCPPPLPTYTCTRIVKPHDIEVVDRTEDRQTETLLFAYDSDAPAQADAYAGQITRIAAMLGSGYYRVEHLRGYASPEASVAYNLKLAQKRADTAHAALTAALQAHSGAPALPAAEGLGELLGAGTGPNETRNADLTARLREQLRGKSEDEQLDLLGVAAPSRADPVRRAQVLEDIQAFLDGRDASGTALNQRALWEKIFPHLRRVEVALHRDAASHFEPAPAGPSAADCTPEDLAFIDQALGPVPLRSRIPPR